MTDYQSAAYKTELKRFLNENPIDKLSAASFAYSIHTYGDDLPRLAQKMVDKIKGVSAESKKEIRTIEKINSASTIDQWMGREISCNQSLDLIHKKMLDYEDQLENRIKQKCFYNRNTFYTENALYFFLHARKNSSSWVKENFENFMDPYLRSMFSLIVGFRGEVSDIEILKKEYEYFSSRKSLRKYNQGPLLGISELACEYLGFTFSEAGKASF